MINPYKALLEASDDAMSEKGYRAEAALLLFTVLIIVTVVALILVAVVLWSIHPLAFFALFVYPACRLWLAGYRRVTRKPQ